jgi:hypothetical protein
MLDFIIKNEIKNKYIIFKNSIFDLFQNYDNNIQLKNALLIYLNSNLYKENNSTLNFIEFLLEQNFFCFSFNVLIEDIEYLETYYYSNSILLNNLTEFKLLLDELNKIKYDFNSPPLLPNNICKHLEVSILNLIKLTDKIDNDIVILNYVKKNLIPNILPILNHFIIKNINIWNLIDHISKQFSDSKFYTAYFNSIQISINNNERILNFFIFALK